MTTIQVSLNRFLIKDLTSEDFKVYQYRCIFTEELAAGQEFQTLGNICYKVGVHATRLGNNIITRIPIEIDRLQGENWNLQPYPEHPEIFLDPSNQQECEALTQLEQKELKTNIKNIWGEMSYVESSAGSLIWWRNTEKGIEKRGDGWEIHRGRKLDIFISPSGSLFLEVDLHAKFFSPYTLQKWQDRYPECPINYLRNTYPDKYNQYKTWRYQETTEETPDSVILSHSNQTLAEYHLGIGATIEEVQNSRVVIVRSSGYGKYRDQDTLHLSSRLKPILTMDTLAILADDPNTSKAQESEIKSIFSSLKKDINQRLESGIEVATLFARRIYNTLEEEAFQPLVVDGYVLEKAKLHGRTGAIQKTADVFDKRRGCVKVGELSFGCLNLVDNVQEYPANVRSCLERIAEYSGVKIFLEPPRTRNSVPKGEIDRQMFWQSWAESGIKTILVVGSHLKKRQWQKIRIEALQAGIAPQFMRPMPQSDQYRAMNITLGLLAKAGWQSIRLEPIAHPQAAELVIGFDAGTNRELYYGTCAFAVLADGQGLGWELPNVQKGETFSGQAIWQTVSQLLLRFNKLCGRLPKQILLMRDGLVQDQEFSETIAALKEKNIAVDVISVRKSGTGRMGIKEISNQGVSYRKVLPGTVVFMEANRSFLLVSISIQNRKSGDAVGSDRPLRIVHEYGNTPLDIIAQQTYQQCQLHPASGYSNGSRLPWVLHLADKTSKELQRIKQVSILQNLDREKLFSV